eukprot:1134371-Pelagomonas_calceolata.AAC.10
MARFFNGSCLHGSFPQWSISIMHAFKISIPQWLMDSIAIINGSILEWSASMTYAFDTHSFIGLCLQWSTSMDHPSMNYAIMASKTSNHWAMKTSIHWFIVRNTEWLLVASDA